MKYKIKLKITIYNDLISLKNENAIDIETKNK